MESVSSRTRSVGGRALKHKLSCEDAESAKKRKKGPQQSLFEENDRLDKAINNGDLSTVIKIVGNSDRKVSLSCLQDALLKAVEAGNKQLVRLLLSHVSFQGKSDIECFVLIAAAKQGNPDIVKLLIEKGADVDGKDSSGNTALITAVEHNSCTAVISSLLEQGRANVNLQNKKGKTALMLAVERWDYETVHILFLGNDGDYIDFKCDEGIKDENGHTALDLAKMNGSARLMKALSESRKQSCSPLTVAIQWKDTDLVKRLVEINPTCVVSPKFGERPLTAAMHGSGDNDGNPWDGKIHCSYKLVEFLVQAGADINGRHLCGLTPLMFAAIAGSVKIAKLLLLHKSKVNDACIELGEHKHYRRRTALMMAADKGWVKIVHILLQAGAKPNYKDIDGETAFSLAVKGSHKACVLALLKKSKSLSSADMEMMTKHKVLDALTGVKNKWNTLGLVKGSIVMQNVLCKAVKTSCYKLVRCLVESGANVNYSSHRLDHPIYFAVDNADMLAFLVKMGADIDFRSEYGNTALMDAASRSYKGRVQNLLKCNANMYAVNVNSYTALSLACREGHGEIITALLDNGMDMNYICNGVTALWSSLLSTKHISLETLIKYGADVNAERSHQGKTLLMEAVETAPLIFSELIIKSGANVNAEDDNGNTALFCALQIKRPEGMGEKAFLKLEEEKISLLLQRGANVNHVNFSMKSPLLLAVQLGFKHNNILKILFEYKAELNVQDEFGNTAAHVAVELGKSDKLEMLASKGADLTIMNHEHKTPLLTAFAMLKIQSVKTLIRLGASVNECNSEIVRSTWETVFDNFRTVISGTCLSYSQEGLCPEKWTLLTWSKLAVRWAVGYEEGREQRVRDLPVPRRLQDELLYIDVSLKPTSVRPNIDPFYNSLESSGYFFAL